MQNNGYKKCFEIWNNNKNTLITQFDYQIPASSGKIYMQSVTYKITDNVVTATSCSEYLSNSTCKAVYNIGIERVVGYTY